MTPSQSKTPPPPPPQIKPPPPPPPLTPSAAAAARPACAACKHQRRRCSAQCPLAPYFPADKQNDFLNVHRLFGIRNVVRLLKDVAPEYRDDAVKSLIHEANFRAMNPVGGCYAVIIDLHRQIEICMAEFQIVARILAFHRAKLLQNFNSFEINENSLQIGEMEDKIGIVEQILNDKPCLYEG